MGLRPALFERYGPAEVEKMNKEERREWLDELRFDAMMEACQESVIRKECEAHLKEVIRDEQRTIGLWQ
jgi:hypothetical protein